MWDQQCITENSIDKVCVASLGGYKNSPELVCQFSIGPFIVRIGCTCDSLHQILSSTSSSSFHKGNSLIRPKGKLVLGCTFELMACCRQRLVFVYVRVRMQTLLFAHTSNVYLSFIDRRCETQISEGLRNQEVSATLYLYHPMPVQSKDNDQARGMQQAAVGWLWL